MLDPTCWYHLNLGTLPTTCDLRPCHCIQEIKHEPFSKFTRQLERWNLQLNRRRSTQISQPILVHRILLQFENLLCRSHPLPEVAFANGLHAQMRTLHWAQVLLAMTCQTQEGMVFKVLYSSWLFNIPWQCWSGPSLQMHAVRSWRQIRKQLKQSKNQTSCKANNSVCIKKFIRMAEWPVRELECVHTSIWRTSQQANLDIHPSTQQNFFRDLSKLCDNSGFTVVAATRISHHLGEIVRIASNNLLPTLHFSLRPRSLAFALSPGVLSSHRRTKHSAWTPHIAWKGVAAMLADEWPENQQLPCPKLYITSKVRTLGSNPGPAHTARLKTSQCVSKVIPLVSWWTQNHKTMGNRCIDEYP